MLTAVVTHHIPTPTTVMLNNYGKCWEVKLYTHSMLARFYPSGGEGEVCFTPVTCGALKVKKTDRTKDLMWCALTRNKMWK